jgi:replication factor C small subunit
MLFSGSAGIGKTSSAIALAKQLFGTHYERNFLELNASDDRGIDVVRNTIKDFARTLPFEAEFKIIFLDESDSLTADAQQALRRTMERYTKTCRFVLSCNYSSRIKNLYNQDVWFSDYALEKESVDVKLKKSLHLKNNVNQSVRCNILCFSRRYAKIRKYFASVCDRYKRSYCKRCL